jgi:O-antigen/teichoic acid export membrane protein
MLKNSLIYLIVRVLNGIIAVASFYFLSRLLSATEYGIYALGTSAIAFFGSVLFQWIAVSMARFYAEHSSRSDVLLNEVMRLFLWAIGISLLVLVVFIILPKSNQINFQLAMAIFVGAIAMGGHNIGLQVANVASKPVYYGLLSTTRSVFAFTLAIAASYWGFGGTGAVLGIAVATAGVVLAFKIIRFPEKEKKDRLLRSELVRYGLPLTLTYLAMMVLDVSDRFIIGLMLGTAAVAPYAAAYDLTQQVIGALANVLFLASFPNIMNAWKKGHAIEAKQAVIPLSNAMLIGAPLVAGLFVGWSSEIAHIVFGPALRRDASLIMPWVVIAVTIGCIKSFFLDVAFQLEKTVHMQLQITVAMATFNVILTIALLPMLGVLGAAVSTAIAFFLGACASWWFGRKLGIYSVAFWDVLKALAVFGCIVVSMNFFPINPDMDGIRMLFRLTVGLGVYLILAVLIDLGGVQSIFARKFRSINAST